MPEPFLEEAQDDATRLAVEDMERAGVDVITDGEMRRESYSNRFATALDGVDLDNPGVALDRTGHENPVPRVAGPDPPHEPRSRFATSSSCARSPTAGSRSPSPGRSRWRSRRRTTTIRDDRSLALAYAEAVNEELRDLKAAGADVVQIDEPYLQARPEPAREYAIEAINRALDGIEGETVLHTCFGYAHIVKTRLTGYPFLRELNDCLATHLSLEAAQPDLDPEVLRDVPDKTIVLGVLDLGSSEAETPDVVADRIRKALTVLPPERLVVAPDCGMKYLPRDWRSASSRPWLPEHASSERISPADRAAHDAKAPDPGRPPHHHRRRRPATSIDFWEGVLGMPFVFEQPNLDNASESHLYFDPGDGRLITVFTNEERERDPSADLDGHRLRAPHRVLGLAGHLPPGGGAPRRARGPAQRRQGPRLHGLDLLRRPARAADRARVVPLRASVRLHARRRPARGAQAPGRAR